MYFIFLHISQKLTQLKCRCDSLVSMAAEGRQNFWHFSKFDVSKSSKRVWQQNSFIPPSRHKPQNYWLAVIYSTASLQRKVQRQEKIWYHIFSFLCPKIDVVNIRNSRYIPKLSTAREGEIERGILRRQNSSRVTWIRSDRFWQQQPTLCQDNEVFIYMVGYIKTFLSLHTQISTAIYAVKKSWFRDLNTVLCFNRVSGISYCLFIYSYSVCCQKFPELCFFLTRLGCLYSNSKISFDPISTNLCHIPMSNQLAFFCALFVINQTRIIMTTSQNASL